MREFSVSRRRDAARERALIRVQAASGALFAVFLVAHLVNQMFAAAGPAVYDEMQGQLRAVYQAPLVELACVGAPLLVHLVVSVWRMVRRRRRGAQGPAAPRMRWQRITAVVLLVFTLGHVVATRGASLVYGVFPGFDGVAYTLVWVFAYFFPYYLLFSIAALYHALNGLALALPRIGLAGPPALRSHRAIVAAWAAGAVALALGLAGLASAWHDVRERAIASPYAQLLVDLGVSSGPAEPSGQRR
jgi:succinate dehydrogenase/fumarate reductase cytochrome b subunit